MNRTICHGSGLFALCNRQKLGEITIFSIARGKRNSEWIVNWSTNRRPVRQIEFDWLQDEAA